MWLAEPQVAEKHHLRMQTAAQSKQAKGFFINQLGSATTENEQSNVVRPRRVVAECSQVVAAVGQ